MFQSGSPVNRSPSKPTEPVSSAMRSVCDSGGSASALSQAVRRLEAQLGVRLLHRTTRSVVPTEAGQRLLERLGPAIGEVEAALDVVNGFRDTPAGTLRLNVPMSASRLVLPALVPDFLAAFPDIQLDVVAEDGFVDLVASGCDAGIRYDELSAPQHDLLLRLIELHVGRMRPDHARVRVQEVNRHLRNTHFCWMGGMEDDSVFYYRVQSPVIIIEFDHQRGIAFRQYEKPYKDHIHVVVRTPNGNDYGKDLLRQHYAAQRGNAAHGHATPWPIASRTVAGIPLSALK